MRGEWNMARTAYDLCGPRGGVVFHATLWCREWPSGEPYYVRWTEKWQKGGDMFENLHTNDVGEARDRFVEFVERYEREHVVPRLERERRRRA